MHPPRSWRRWFVALTLVATVSASVVVETAAAATALPACSVGDTYTARRLYVDWAHSMLDTKYRLSAIYYPQDLVSTSNAGLASGFKVRTFVIPDLKAMTSAAKAAGARFSVQSAFRSYATQKSTFDYWVKLHGYAYALKESARPGHSEHQMGTTLDLRSYGGAAPWDVADWASTKAGKWLGANAWKYGFIMSYPKGKTSLTCYMYEPWHFHYIGRARAKLVHDSGLTLRQFLWREQHP